MAQESTTAQQLRERAYDDLRQLHKDLGYLYDDAVRIVDKYHRAREVESNKGHLSTSSKYWSSEDAAERAQHKIWDALDAIAKQLATDQALNGEKF